MKAIICTKYGPPEVLKLQEIKKPVPKDNEVLIKVYATAVTASDSIIRKFKIPARHRFPMGIFMEIMMGFAIGFKRPRNPVLGLIVSGEIEEVGKKIRRFKKGDQVYGFTGYGFGAYAEYVCMKETDSKVGCLALKPSTMSFEEAAAVTYGAVLATHFIKKINIHKGDKVLVYGASGAIGTFAVQLLKYLGAEVTSVCSSSNFDLVKSLGSDKELDYTDEDAANRIETYKLVFDAVGEIKSSGLKESARKSLSETGKYISVDDGSPKLLAENLDMVRKLIEAGHIRAVIDSTYSLEQMVEAHRYVDGGHKKGNVVISVTKN